MMNKKVKKIIPLAAAVLLTNSMAVSVCAAEEADYIKNENVYGRLNTNGDVKGVYVVNSFQVNQDGEITDYGDYKKIQNLTDDKAIQENKSEYTLDLEEGKFYYQGDIENAELPWMFDITYTLDGNEAEMDELAGENGDLIIKCKITDNPAFDNKQFYNTYLKQVSFTLDPELVKNIEAEGATITDAGSNENVTFIVYPGMDAELVLSAEVDNFEMDDISINATLADSAIPAISYADIDKNVVNKTNFMISVEGIQIEEAVEEVEETVEKGFAERLLELIRGLFQ